MYGVCAINTHQEEEVPLEATGFGMRLVSCAIQYFCSRGDDSIMSRLLTFTEATLHKSIDGWLPDAAPGPTGRVSVSVPSSPMAGAGTCLRCTFRWQSLHSSAVGGEVRYDSDLAHSSQLVPVRYWIDWNTCPWNTSRLPEALGANCGWCV